MHVPQVLSGEHGLTGIRWLLYGAEPQAMLKDELRLLLNKGHHLRSLNLRRTKFKPGRKLRAYYDLKVSGGLTECVYPITVTWRPLNTAYEDSTDPIQSDLEAKIHAQGGAAPFRQLASNVVAWQMNIQVYPLDADFPQLVRLTSPQYVSDMLAPYNGTRDALSQRRMLNYSVMPIRYRPGQRHVLRYNFLNKMQPTNDNSVIFAKLYNNEAGAQSLQVFRWISGWLEKTGSGFKAVRPLAYIPGDGTVLYRKIVGTPLSYYLQSPNGVGAKSLPLSIEHYLWQAGAMLRLLHQDPGEIGDDLKLHTFDEEVGLVARASEHIHALSPHIHEKIDRLLERLQALYKALPPTIVTFVHKDFKADHIWLTTSGLTVIDFDSCCLADPAIDIGKFLADLQWWFIHNDNFNLTRAQTCFLTGYQGQGFGDELNLFPSDSLTRFRLYEILWLIKAGIRRFRLFEPNWEERTAQVIHRASKSLNELTPTI